MSYPQSNYYSTTGYHNLGSSDCGNDSGYNCDSNFNCDGPFEGGEFGYRPLGGGDDAVEVALAPGDVVVCPSEMEHRVGPVLAGVRVSMNIDFWDVEEGNDRRSEFDRF